MAERDTGPGHGDNPEPVDEDAAWAAIVAGYDEEALPPEGRDGPAGDVPDDRSEDGGVSGDEPGEGVRTSRVPGAPAGADADTDEPRPEHTGTAAGPSAVANRPLGSGITIHPVGIGPRDWPTPEPAAEDEDEDDHFVPPEPPPLPEVDTTTKFAWLAVLGGPLLLLLTVVLQWEMTWWILTLGLGGFLGGFATLVGRMNDDDDDGYDDPGRGAVV